jgi:tRNA A-37 threonylcarbamoyl transferase component Bud32/type II secretory pathway pseudopilin PulG
MQATLPTEAGKSTGAKPVPPTEVELVTAFPQLEILGLIGQGGMGFVFKARQPKLDRFVALKILPASLAADPAFAERFTREGRVLARLSHPNIVAIHDFGLANGLFYLVMEFVDGVNLRQAMKAGRFTPGQALAIVPKICEALQFAHNEGILHRDIKPENILLDTKGRIKIADFGIAKLVGEPCAEGSLTASGAALGTPHYMAPEQLEQPQNVDQRADVYSLGVVFYEMLTGELPIGRFAPPSEKSAVDSRVDDVVLHTLEKERERRTQTAGEVKTQVETIAGTPPTIAAGKTVSVPGAPTQPSADRFWRRFAVTVFTFIALLILVPAIGILTAIALPAFLKARQRAQAAQQKLQTRAATNTISAAAETWSPAEAPRSVGLQTVLSDEKELMLKGEYEGALQRLIWYYNHSKGDPSQAGVRLSFALSDWVELGRRYPKARQALIEIRDANVAEFDAGRGYFELFMEVSSMNQYLGDDDATVALFKDIGKRDKRLAEQCYGITEPALIERAEYTLCLKYIGSPQARFDSIRQNWERMRSTGERQKGQWRQQKERYGQMAATNSAFQRVQFPMPPDLANFADKSFIAQTRQLIQILIATGQKAVAERIRDQAIGVLSDPGLGSAVIDAEERVQKQNLKTNQ